MPKVALASFDEAPVIARPEGSVGEVETRALFGRDSDPIHLHAHRLAPGAAMRFSGAPTDCLVYVWEGAVDAGGRRLGPRSSAIVEYGASLTASACAEGVTLLAFRLKARGADERAGGRVHLMPSEHAARVDNPRGDEVDGVLHADSQCPTCKLWLHENDFRRPDVETPLHFHTADEVIFVRAGSMRIGPRIYGPGTAIAVAANTKYGFFSGPDGLSFVNFRGEGSKYAPADGSEAIDESEIWHPVAGKPHHLAPLFD